MGSVAHVRALLLLAAVGILVAGRAGQAAAPGPVWLCRPGLPHNPCVTSLATGVFAPGGELQRTFTPATPAAPKIDCFYLYPTVSTEQSVLSDLRIQTAETDVALYQAAYFRQVCRVYAPMYRQATLLSTQIPGAVTPADAAEQYASVLDAWRSYLAHDNDGRGFVLIGHSQGAFVLRKLIAEQIDPNPQLRKRLVSALLFGGAVVVKKGSLVGGDFKHIPGCSAPAEIGCVVSYSSFGGTPPPGAVFGSSTWTPTDGQAPLLPGQAILCTNPAALGGGAADLDAVFPASFPASAGAPVPPVEARAGAGTPAWFEYTTAYRAACVEKNGSDVLEVTPVNGARPLVSTGALAPRWGLHPLDVNLGLGDAVRLVASETRTYIARSGK
jgi:Protein of unknown function (DUF3089)